ncbi:MAG TPA: glucose-1-phosphate adenylyltransferase [Candidatus Omnitrophota bacterium]|nr:glucose-1-phosphate adenylyltransferase [Candidatus Omnitrophota bacterium]HPT07452.1 glucose-1-phosphate adenylyltransferase [Candidatus Omnitrophota bacterium]
MKDVVSIILGGGRGTRLYPLTKYRAKPAVPVAGKYRLVDIPISNCINSGFRKIYILTQFNSGSLNRHIFRAYKMDSFTEGFVEIIAADQSMEHADWFQGSADAVRKCLKHISDPRIKYVLILSGDQLYKMDFSLMLAFHIEKKSELTIACNPVSKEETVDLGIMGVDKEHRIKHFVEKPKHEKEISGFAVKVDAQNKYLASTGIYIFNKEALVELLLSTDGVDFGKEVIPEALEKKKTYAYIYNGYWKDIGSIQSFYEENLLFASAHPPLDLYDENWQFFTRPRYLPMTKVTKSLIEDSTVAEGAIIEQAAIKNSVVGLRSIIGAGTEVSDSILLGCDYYDFTAVPRLGIGKNCVIKKAIIDKNVRMGDNVHIVNKKNVLEFENQLCVIKNGIVIIPKSAVIPSGTVI